MNAIENMTVPQFVALVAQAKAEWEKADIAATMNYLLPDELGKGSQAALNAIAEHLEAIYLGLQSDLDEAEAEFRADACGDKF